MKQIFALLGMSLMQFMRDEGDGGRYDAQTAQLGYQLALNLFSRTLR